MRIHAIIFSLMLGLFSLGALAGAGHDHGPPRDPVSQAKAEAIAMENLAKLVTGGKLDPSWKAVSVAKAEQKNFGGHMEWVVSFKNTAISDPAKQTLYVFLTISGEYLAANFTGN